MILAWWWLHKKEKPRRQVTITATRNGDRFDIEKYRTEYEHNIAGINYRRLDDSYLGDFDGIVKTEPDNQYDPNAIAIYKGRKKVGYIPRTDNKYIYRQLEEAGGKAPCYGYIDKGEEDGRSFYYGRINIKWDK